MIEMITQRVLANLPSGAVYPPIRPQGIAPSQGKTWEGENVTGKRLVPVAVSARHIHLSKQTIATLFGPEYILQPRNPLSQPGQFAAQETVSLIGPKKVISGVRILGPARVEDQVELSISDGISLGLDLPVRDSGDIKGSPGFTVSGPRGCVFVPQGAIAARRHLHADPQSARRLNLKDGQIVSVLCSTKRPVIFQDIMVRVNKAYALELHLDTDEANACNVKNGDLVEIV